MRRLLFVVVLLVLTCALGQAAIIYSNPTVLKVGDQWEYSYNAVLQADQKIDTTVAPSFAVLYDFHGFVAGSYRVINVAVGLQVTTAVELTSTPPFEQVPKDDRNVINLRSVITGAYNSDFNDAIYTVVARSIYSPGMNRDFRQAAQALSDDPYSSALTGNVRSLTGPAPTPEPGTLAMIGCGLLALGYFRRR